METYRVKKIKIYVEPWTEADSRSFMAGIKWGAMVFAFGIVAVIVIAILQTKGILKPAVPAEQTTACISRR